MEDSHDTNSIEKTEVHSANYSTKGYELYYNNACRFFERMLLNLNEQCVQNDAKV